MQKYASINRRWWKESIIYQIYPRSFQDSNQDGVGDLRGIIQRLDYLRDLGVDIIWLSPIFKSPNDDNGYDVSDYEDIMNEFGTMADFDELLVEIKKRQMRLILDLVANHSSDEHRWFVEAKKSKDNPYRDYYIWRPQLPDNEELPNNWVSFFGGAAWELEPATQEYYLHLFTKKQPDLNWENPEVRQAIYKTMKFWLDKGVDGWRMDVIPFISKKPGLPSFPADFDGDIGRFYANGPRMHEFLQEMYQEVLSQYDVMTVGEGIGLSPETAPEVVDERRQELSMIYHFDHMALDRKTDNFYHLRPEGFSLIEFKAVFARWDAALGDYCWNSILLGNHDFPRMVSRFGNDADFRVESAKLLATLLMTMKGTPYIYQGDELGMTNTLFQNIEDFDDVQIRNYYQEWQKTGQDSQTFIAQMTGIARDHARTPMQWNNSSNAGFTEGTPWLALNPNYPSINAQQALSNPDSIYYYYQKLIALRKHNLALIYGKYTDIDPQHPHIFAYTRVGDKGEGFLIILNFGVDVIHYQIPNHLKISQLVFSNYPFIAEKNPQVLPLQAYEARVYSLG
ncbi:MAG: alpha-glucosidase [Microscillaceae bacterium]|nr:alpha-glucosidase [Microscillaceae bacterium]